MWRVGLRRLDNSTVKVRAMPREAQQPQLTLSEIHLYMQDTSGSGFINKHHALSFKLANH